MRTRSVNYWERKISELNNPENKRFGTISSFPRNKIEEMNYQIAEYMIEENKKSAA